MFVIWLSYLTCFETEKHVCDTILCPDVFNMSSTKAFYIVIFHSAWDSSGSEFTSQFLGWSLAVPAPGHFSQVFLFYIPRSSESSVYFLSHTIVLFVYIFQNNNFYLLLSLFKEMPFSFRYQFVNIIRLVRERFCFSPFSNIRGFIFLWGT